MQNLRTNGYIIIKQFEHKIINFYYIHNLITYIYTPISLSEDSNR